MAIDPKADGPTKQPKADDEGVLDKVARTIGKASGVVVAAASKVLPNSESEKPFSIPKNRVRNAGVAKRATTKKQKRKTHKRKLKRGNTKG